jgi:2-polyprenyl-3-methyl-5-hydroxy-6-metoxy-1,4-benzoquinol methylase
MTLNSFLRRFSFGAKTRPPRWSPEEIQKRKSEIESKYGRWLASHIELGEGITTDAVMTGGNTNVTLWSRFHQFSQIILALTARPLDDLRVLDLAVHEGVTSIELALQGAEVVGIEGREMNIVKARFAAEALGLENVKFHQDDVMNISREKYGEFDVVLCAGILYHLNVQEACALVEKIAGMCKRCVIVDTHCSLTPREFAGHGGQTRYGHSTIDHFPENKTLESRQSSTYSSLNNDFVFFLTKSTLINLLAENGFGTVFESVYPDYDRPIDRFVLAGVRVPRTTVKVFVNPALALARVPEKRVAPRTILIPGHEYADGNPQTRKLFEGEAG